MIPKKIKCVNILISVSKVRDVKGVEVEAGKGLENAHKGVIDDPVDNQGDVDGDVTEPGIVDQPDKTNTQTQQHSVKPCRLSPN